MNSTLFPALGLSRRLLVAFSVAACLLFVLSLGGVDLQSSTTADDKPEKLLRHVVQFKFKETSSKEDVSKVVQAFRGLKGKISEVAAFEYGTDNSPEGLANGFTHCFFLTFKSEAARDTYLHHAAHMAFVDIVKPHVDKVQVVDYWAAE